MKKCNHPSSNILLMTSDIQRHFKVIHHPPHVPYHLPDNPSNPTEYYSDQDMLPDTGHKVQYKLDD
eukprot:3003805-Ditylum_brightwellii.AAC.1